jgi:hypothetical protein
LWKPNEHYRWAMDLYEDHPDDPQPEDLAAPWLANSHPCERPHELVEDVSEVLTWRATASTCALGWWKRNGAASRAAAILALAELIPRRSWWHCTRRRRG